MSEHRYAVLIDGENIAPRFLGPILAEINRTGEIILTRVYGDWTELHMGGWKELLQSYPVRPVQQFRYGQNATDGALIMDAIEIVSTNRNPVNAFCIVSSDSDYYSLALRLREHGMYVCGIGPPRDEEHFGPLLQPFHLPGKPRLFQQLCSGRGNQDISGGTAGGGYCAAGL